MKRLFLVLLCFISVLRLFSQTPEESALFDKINQHRDSLGLKKLVWDTSAYNMAVHHAKYITIINSAPYNKDILTHDENITIPGFEKLTTPFDRFNRFVRISKWNPSIENCAIRNIATNLIGKTDKYKKGTNTISKLMFNAWITSKKGHKENIEDKTVSKGACSIMYYTTELDFNTTGGKKRIQLTCAVAVFNAY